MEPLISVIIPVYNVEKYLDRCVKSVVNQTYKNIEIILVNDGSTDNSPTICDHWAETDNRIKVIHKSNGGASSARNIGLKNALGEIISFVDSDDWIECNMFSELYDLMDKNSADIAISECKLVTDKKIRDFNKNLTVFTEVWDRKTYLEHFFRINGEERSPGVSGRIIKKEILNNYKFVEGRMNEDIHAEFYIAAKCRSVVYTNKVFYNYFVNTSGVTRSGITVKKLDLLYIWDMVSQLVTEMSPEYSYACEMNKKRARFTLLSQMLLNGYDKSDKEMLKIKKQLKKEVRNSFWNLMKWKMPISRKILLIIVCVL